MKRQDSNKVYNVAAYCRFSKDDGGVTDSSSIETQIEKTTSYAKERNWVVYDTYIDDGFTGMNYNRPSFKRMISDIESGLVDCVVTKDLSRLGRNRIETDLYIEIWFPEHNIRYIAIDDDVDTSIVSNSSFEITPFKTLLNEMYAMDISKKTRSAKRTRLLQGKYIAAGAPYGYLKDPEDKNRLIIDQEKADVVKRIFDLAKEGLGLQRIRLVLMNDGIFRPSITASERRCGSYGSYEGKDRYNWDPTTIYSILNNPVYYGSVVGNTQGTVSAKSKRSRKIPRSEWIIVDGSHEAIVSKEDFDLVRKIMENKGRKRENTNHYYNIFAGLLCCDDCGHSLRIFPYRRKSRAEAVDNSYYACGWYSKLGTSVCTRHAISARDLYETVLQSVREHAQAAVEGDKDLLDRVFYKVDNNSEHTASNLKKELSALENRASAIDKIFADLYEDKASGSISNRNYSMLSSKFEQEQSEIGDKILKIKQSLNTGDDDASRIKRYINNFREYSCISELTIPLLRTLIDKITVSEVTVIDGARIQTVNIYYKFMNGSSHEKTLSKVKSVQNKDN